jgi:hypothetical protein
MRSCEREVRGLFVEMGGRHEQKASYVCSQSLHCAGVQPSNDVFSDGRQAARLAYGMRESDACERCPRRRSPAAINIKIKLVQRSKFASGGNPGEKGGSC